MYIDTLTYPVVIQSITGHKIDRRNDVEDGFKVHGKPCPVKKDHNKQADTIKKREKRQFLSAPNGGSARIKSEYPNQRIRPQENDLLAWCVCFCFCVFCLLCLGVPFLPPNLPARPNSLSFIIFFRPHLQCHVHSFCHAGYVAAVTSFSRFDYLHLHIRLPFQLCFVNKALLFFPAVFFSFFPTLMLYA